TRITGGCARRFSPAPARTVMPSPSASTPPRWRAVLLPGAFSLAPPGPQAVSRMHSDGWISRLTGERGVVVDALDQHRDRLGGHALDILVDRGQRVARPGRRGGRHAPAH